MWLVLSGEGPGLTGRDGGAVTLLIGDDGKGMSLSGDQAGFGLHGLRERAAQLGGELHIEPRRGGGTQVSFRLPVETGQPPVILPALAGGPGSEAKNLAES